MTLRSMLGRLCAAAIAVLGVQTALFAAPGDVVISQIWGGSTTTGVAAHPKADYVELFNRSASAVSLNGWSLNIATTGGTAWGKCDLPNFTMPAGSYFLVRVSNDNTTGVNLPAVDATFPTPISTTLTTSGKVCLRDTTAAIGAVNCPAGNIVDLVTYGTSGTCFEGAGRAPANNTATSAPLATFRRGDGCLDTDDNANDFVARAPAPRNSASPTSTTCIVGACCNNNTGVCVTDTSANCAADGLSFTTVGTACASNPCPPTGACCSGTSFTTCNILTLVGCGSNLYAGNNTVCTPNACASTSCCFSNGSCCNFSPPHCLVQGGTPGSLAVTCGTAGNCIAAPANDLCTSPATLSLGVPVTGNLFAATSTGDGPFAPCLNSINQSTKGVWYTFVPPASSVYELSACGSTFDCDLTVFTIPTCADPATWTVIGCDDQACPVGTASFCATNGNTLAPKLSGLPLTAGLTYYVRMSLNGSSATGGGNFTLTVTDLGTVATGACCYVTNGRCDIRTQVSCTEATVNPIGVYQGDGTTCTAGLCGSNYGACCSSGGCQMRLETSCTGTSVFWLDGEVCYPNPCLINPLPPNGTCATAAILTDSDFPFTSLVGINQAPDGPAVSCTSSAPAVTKNAIWYTYMPSADCVLSAWEIGSRDVTVVVYDNGVANPACDSANWTTVLCETEETDANVPLLAGHRYYILVASSSASTNVNDFYSLKFRIVVPAVPTNSTCASAAAITPSASFQSFPGGGSASGPRSSCQTLSYQPPEARNAIWFTYTTPANADQLVRLQRTLVSSNNIFFSLAFYTGDCNNLNAYECANLGTADQFIRLRRNTTYYVMAHKRSGYLAGDGQYTFLFDVLTPPQASNQDCATATPIPALPYADTVNNVLAFDELPVSNCSGNSVTNGSGIWYSFTPASPVVVNVGETGPQNAAIAVFENSCTNRILCTAVDEDPVNNTFRAYPGFTYYILIARETSGLPAQTDTFTISVTGTEVPTPPNDDCFTATTIASLPFTETTMIGTARDDIPRAVCSRGTITTTTRNGIWYTYTNNSTPAGVVMAETSGLDAIIAAYKGQCGSLVPVMCTDEPESGVYLFMEAYTTYHILVAKAFDFSATPTEAVSFSISPATPTVFPPVNQACDVAQKIATLPFSYTGVPIAAANGPVTACANQPVSLLTSQSTNPLWYTFDSGSGYTLRIWELSSNDVTYALYSSCGGIEEGCNTSDGSVTTPVFFTLNPGTRYYLQVARQTNSDYALSAVPYQLSISVADGTAGACCTGTFCTTGVIENCAAAFVPGGTCNPANPVACCPANYNQNNGLEIQDIFDFLNGWFGSAARADFNGNGRLEVQDIFDFLNAWFAGCH